MGMIPLSEVFALPVDERIRLVGAIWDSIAEHPESLPLTESERVELDRRMDAYLKDPSAGQPWVEVKARLTKT